MRNHLPSARALRWIGLPAVAGALVLLGQAAEEDGRVLMALAKERPKDPGELDEDMDGLVAHQEFILGTLDTNPDFDGDHVSDLVELARGSDPTNAASIPAPQSVSVGMTARAKGSTVTMLTAIYASFSEFPTFGLKMGLSLGGVEVPLPLSTVLAVSKLKLHPGFDPSGWIIVLEIPVPTAWIATYGSLGAYTIVSKTGSTTPEAAAVVNMILVDGHPVLILPAPDGFKDGVGSIYQPLGRGEDIPGSWAKGMVCWQLTSPVGSDGSSIILDVEDAGCEPLDSSCSASDCAASIGTQHKVLDPGALAGGG